MKPLAEGGIDLFLPETYDIVWSLVILVIIAAVFYKVVLPKFQAVFDERAARIEGGIAKAEQAQKDADARVAAVQFDARLDGAIGKRRGRSAKAIKALLDMDALRGSKNQDQDIDAALDALQKDSGYLFEPVETPPPYAAGTGTAAVRQTNNRDVAMRRAMGLPDKAADQK